MARADRMGNRKSRESFKKRVPDLGYYFVVTDTNETEERYMYGLRDSLPKEYQGRIVIKVSKAKTEELVSTCKEQAALEPQYGEPWIVFDRDRVVRFDEIIKQANELAATKAIIWPLFYTGAFYLVFVGFLILFIFAMCKVRGEKQYVTGGQKWWIALVCLLSVGMILMGMLLTWTPFGYVSIEGVQGRYFTPLLLLLSLLGRNNSVLLNQNKDRGIFCGGMMLQLLAIIYLIKTLIIIA